MKAKGTYFPSHASGFSLIEIMVGMVIGLLGIIIMMQVVALTEERKRTSTAGGDAQNNAVIALDGLQRDITQSGFGFANNRLLNCTLQLPSGGTVPLAPVIINPPAAIIPAGDANTDTLLVAYGSSNDQPEGYTLTFANTSPYSLSATGLLALGDRVFAIPAACGATTLILGIVQAVTPTTVRLSTTEAGTALFNLGPAPRFRAYAIRGGNLTMCDYMVNDCATAANVANPAIWQTIGDNIVSLRAEYGRDATVAMDGIVDTYDQTTPATACNWARTSAVRLALVARSAQFEKDVVTAAAPVWQGSLTAPITLPNAAGWDHYRYRVYQTLLPIRNISWMGVVSGC